MRKNIIRVISIILLQTFLFYNIGFATVDNPQPTTQNPEPTVSIDDIGLSKDLGTIKNRYRGKDGRLVIHIQDAHCNYEAQTNIAKILEYLVKNYNINLVAVEGADGVVDTSWFKAFPDAEIRKEVADYFMKKGEITGAEFLSITSDYPFTIYGAEDRKYYIKNLNSFLESYPYKEEFQKYYTGIKSVLSKLKRFIYTNELIELDRKIEQHKEKEIEFADYTRYLNEVSKSKKVDIDGYENFKILVETLRYEKDINFDIVNEERATLIDELSKKLSKDKISELVNKSLAFKLGKIDNNDFYTYLAKLSKENDISLSKKYNNLARYIIYSHIYSKIDNEKLFDEIDLLVAAIKDKMFKNEDQRELDRLWTNVNIVLGFMDIELTNKEYDYYLANKEEFAPDKFTNFIMENSSRFGLAYNITDPPSELAYIFPKLVDFYEIASRRDELIIKNMFKGMRGKKTDVAVLVTGGFHTKGIEKSLESKDVSYIVISPTITKEVESPYISVLTGQKTPFEELLVETKGKQELAVPLLSDYDILKGILNFRLNQETERLVRDILARRQENIELYAGLFMHAFIMRSPDTPQEALYSDMLSYFDEISEGRRFDGNVKNLIDYFRSNRTLFNNIYGTAQTQVKGLIGMITTELRGQEFTPEEQFEKVKDILLEHAPLLAVKLESLRELRGEKDVNVIVTKIARISSNRLEEETFKLAFFTPGEGEDFANNVRQTRAWVKASYQKSAAPSVVGEDARRSEVQAKEISRELNKDIYQRLFEALDTIEELVHTKEIRPDVRLRISESDALAHMPDDLNRPARVAFLPLKGDPWQVGHLFVILKGIAEHKLDKVVVMVDNSDPRKPNLSSLAIREPITKALLERLGPLVQYTPLPKEHEELFAADGETVIFKLISLNNNVPMEMHYMVGSDHRYWEKEGKPDTTSKLFGHRKSGLYGYELGKSPNVNIIFIERKGEPLTDKAISSLEERSGMKVYKILQPMDTSATRVREEHHYWTVPWDMRALARTFRFWGFESQIAKQQERLSEELIQLTKKAVSAENEDDYQRVKSEIASGLQQAFGPAINSIDMYVMKAISQEPDIRKKRLEEIRSFLFLRSEAIVRQKLTELPAQFQALIEPEKAPEYYSENTFVVDGKEYTRDDQGIAALKEAISNRVTAMRANIPGVGEIAFEVDTELISLSKYYGINIQQLIRDAITESIKIRGPDAYKGIKEVPITLALLDKSQSFFEDHKQNHFIGINRVIFDIITKQASKEALEVILATGIAHELRHEAGEIDEMMLTKEDINLTTILATQRGIAIDNIITALESVTGKSLFLEGLLYLSITPESNRLWQTRMREIVENQGVIALDIDNTLLITKTKEEIVEFLKDSPLRDDFLRILELGQELGLKVAIITANDSSEQLPRLTDGISSRYFKNMVVYAAGGAQKFVYNEERSEFEEILKYRKGLVERNLIIERASEIQKILEDVANQHKKYLKKGQREVKGIPKGEDKEGNQVAMLSFKSFDTPDEMKERGVVDVRLSIIEEMKEALRKKGFDPATFYFRAAGGTTIDVVREGMTKQIAIEDIVEEIGKEEGTVVAYFDDEWKPGGGDYDVSHMGDNVLKVNVGAISELSAVNRGELKQRGVLTLSRLGVEYTFATASKLKQIVGLLEEKDGMIPAQHLEAQLKAAINGGTIGEAAYDEISNMPKEELIAYFESDIEKTAESLPEDIFGFGKAYDIRGNAQPLPREVVDLTPQNIYLVGKLLGTFYAREGERALLTGDIRLHTPILRYVMALGIASVGVNADYASDFLTTGAHNLMTAENEGNYRFIVQVSGSHNVPQKNGFKIKVDLGNGVLEPLYVERLEELYRKRFNFRTRAKTAAITHVAGLRERVVNMLDETLPPINKDEIVVIDSRAGAAGPILVPLLEKREFEIIDVDEIFKRVGLVPQDIGELSKEDLDKVSNQIKSDLHKKWKSGKHRIAVLLNIAPDGNMGRGIWNPAKPEALEATQELVKIINASATGDMPKAIGTVFDGDADRITAILEDSKGVPAFEMTLPYYQRFLLHPDNQEVIIRIIQAGAPAIRLTCDVRANSKLLSLIDNINKSLQEKSGIRNKNLIEGWMITTGYPSQLGFVRNKIRELDEFVDSRPELRGNPDFMRKFEHLKRTYFTAEASGHNFFHTSRTYPYKVCDDAIAAFVTLIHIRETISEYEAPVLGIEEGKARYELTELFDRFPAAYSSNEIAVPIPNNIKIRTAYRIGGWLKERYAAELKPYNEPVKEDDYLIQHKDDGFVTVSGFKVQLKDGRAALVRWSNTSAKLTTIFEGYDLPSLLSIMKEVTERIREEEVNGADLSDLDKEIERLEGQVLPPQFRDGRHEWTPGKEGEEIRQIDNHSIFYVQGPDGTWSTQSGGVPRENLEPVSSLPIMLDRYSGEIVLGEGLESEPLWTRPLKNAGNSVADTSVVEKYPDRVIYHGKRDVRRAEDTEIVDREKLRFDITGLQSGTIGEELVMTKGHIHTRNPETGTYTHSEFYEVWYGYALYLQQGISPDTREFEVIATFAKPGDKVLLLPGYSHRTVNIGNTPLVMANWISDEVNGKQRKPEAKKVEADFTDIETKQGYAYHVIKTRDGIALRENLNYGLKPARLRFMTPVAEISELGLSNTKPMYSILGNEELTKKLGTFLRNPEGLESLFTTALHPETLESFKEKVQQSLPGTNVEVQVDSTRLEILSRMESVKAWSPKPEQPNIKVGIADDGSVVEEYTLNMGEALPSELLTFGLSHRIFVKEGEIAIVDEHGEEIKTAAQGEVISVVLKDYKVYGKADSVAYLLYEPSEAESMVIAGYEAMSSPLIQKRFDEIRAGERKPIIVHVPTTMYANNMFREEKAILRVASGGAVHLTQYGRDIDGLKDMRLDPAYEHVFLLHSDDLERVRQDRNLMERLESVLTQKFLPVKRPKDETKGVANVREIETAAVTLGLTDKDEITENQVAGSGLTLQRIISRLLKRAIEPEALLALMPSDFTQIARRIEVALKEIVPVTQEIDRVIRARRELLWSL